MRPRFRLRTLLILTALAAATCYWWIARPTIVAQRFMAALERSDFVAADAMISPATPPYFERIMNGANDTTPAGWKATLQPRTWDDLWNGRRQIDVLYFGLLETDDSELPYGPAIATPIHVELIVTPPRRRIM